MEGNYLVGNPSSSIAVCTLADTDLPSELSSIGILEHIAIIGPLATENLGIEHVVRNIVTNPDISFLVLCGRDSRGHQAGQAIKSLKENGVEGNRRIIGALGPRSVLKNISDEELEAFRKHVIVVDEIGIRDSARLTEVIKACLVQPKGSMPILPPKVNIPKKIDAQHHYDWVPDSEGFFAIMLKPDTSEIICEHYTQDGVLNVVIRGTNAEDISNTVIKCGLISRLDHSAYLGRELLKAEIALATGVFYKQDEPLALK